MPIEACLEVLLIITQSEVLRVPAYQSAHASYPKCQKHLKAFTIWAWVTVRSYCLNGIYRINPKRWCSVYNPVSEP